MAVIYLDSFALLNLGVNYLILACAGKLDGQPVHMGRCLLGAGLGAGYALLTLLPGWSFLEHPACKASGAVAMLLVAYGRSDRLLRVGALFLVLSCAFGGGLLLFSMVRGETATGIGILGPPLGMRGILIAAALSYGFLSFLLGREFSHGGPGRELMRLTLSRQGNSVTLLALRDTGNTLRDPLTGRPVVVVEGEKVRTLLPELPCLDREALSDPVALLGRLKDRKGLRLQLLPLRMDRAEYGRVVCRNCLTALSPTPVSDGGNYSALIGGD